MDGRFGAIVAFLAAALLSAVASGQFPGSSPAEATFADAIGDRIRSDGGGPFGAETSYPDSEPCVVSSVGKKGSFFLRTAFSESSCTPITPDNSDLDRALVLDFSYAIVRTPDGSGGIDPCLVDDAYGQLGPKLNICGPNTLTDVRIIADKLFTTSSSTPVTVPFQLATSYRNTAFQLAFEQPVSKDPSGSTRTLTAGPLAIAELYKYRPKGPKISLGRFYMPFIVTVTKF